jgi:acyl-CoA reductase-like NAD-dependent aldehyde dehydrogenase
MTTGLAFLPTPKKKTTTKAKATAYQSVSPYHGRILKTFDELTAAHLETAIKTVAICIENRRLTTFVKRADIGLKAADFMCDRAETFTKLL